MLALVACLLNDLVYELTYIIGRSCCPSGNKCEWNFCVCQKIKQIQMGNKIALFLIFSLISFSVLFLSFFFFLLFEYVRKTNEFRRQIFISFINVLYFLLSCHEPSAWHSCSTYKNVRYEIQITYICKIAAKN